MRDFWWRWSAAVLGLAVVVGLLFNAGVRVTGGDLLGDAGAIEFALSTNAAALASTLGILIALVLLMVQLTAQRYSFHVIDLFIRRPASPILVVLFIVTITYSIWLCAAMANDFVPEEGAFLALALGTLCFALLLPYFYSLFGFLRPTTILAALEDEALRAVRSAVRGEPPAQGRARASRQVQNLGDIALSAIQLSDVETARHSVDAIARVVNLYQQLKADVPHTWFHVEEAHFLGHSALTLSELAESRTWLEMRAFLELQRVFNATLNGLSDVNSATTRALRGAAEHALLDDGDESVTRLALKFFNTFLRAAINRGDIRAAYHLLYQYRLLAEHALDVSPAIADEIARRIAYYGAAAHQAGIGWVAVTAAYDLRKLGERPDGAFAVTALLALVDRVRLTVARQPEVGREIAKSVVALASYALAHQRRDLVDALMPAVAALPADHLDAAVVGLQAVEDPFFWELTDRVIDFDYLEPAVRAQVEAVRQLARPPAADGPRPAEGDRLATERPEWRTLLDAVGMPAAALAPDPTPGEAGG